MNYELKDIKVAAYNWQELSNMTQAERNLWQGLGYAYECFRCGESKDVCDSLAQNYIDMFQKGMMGAR